MDRWKTALVGVALVTAAACGGGSSREPARADDAAPVAVAIDAVSVTSIPDTFEAGGVLVSRQTAHVAARIMAPVVKVAVQPGDRVRRGQVLIELDGDEALARSAGAGATLASAQASARAAAAERTAAEAALALAKSTHDRMTRLHAERSATTQELDQAAAALRQAEARVTAAAAHIDAAARAVDAADAGAQLSTITRSWTTLVSPMDGIVSARHVDPGSTAAPGQPLLTIEAPTALQMDVRLDASRAAGLTLGQTAQLRVETAGASDWVDARIVEIARVDPTSHSFIVTLEPPSDASWRSGYFGRARFSGPASPRLTAPVAAVVTRGQLTFVYQVNADGIARLRVVSLGREHGGRVEVLSGLAEGDRVVVDPSATLADGAKVRS